MTTAPSAHPTVAVVGAGISGLVLARVLQRHPVDCTVHELDPSPAVRRQGGRLDIHDDSGKGAGGRPEIDRAALRELLFASLDPGRIAWGHRLTGVRPRAGGGPELDFADGGLAARR